MLTPELLQDTAPAADQRVLLSGLEALALLPIRQRQLDRSRGLSTAGLISGYRGSPLGGYDLQLGRVADALARHDIVFQPAINEDLAATALLGSQLARAFGPTRVDGVFGIWYGKGPGVDRSADALRCANALGTAALGGVLAVAGDDHGAQSSTYAHQSDTVLQALSIPVLQPGSVADIVELGLAGLALSRYCGLWVGLKVVSAVADASCNFELGALPDFVTPSAALPAHGLNWDGSLRWPEQRSEIERRLLQERLPAVLAWAGANRLDRVVFDAPVRRLGVVGVGKAVHDLLQALRDLDLDEAQLAAYGVSVYKVAMSWPLEPDGALAFARGQQELLVVEEKRGCVETQLKQWLYHRADAPRISGKTDPEGAALLPEHGEFDVMLVAQALLARLHACGVDVSQPRQRLAVLRGRATPPPVPGPARKPFFCAGCPHNASTRVPQDSISGGGIGCHIMALSQPELHTTTFTQMGGEGVQWVGAAPFSRTRHVFQNLGDGTYQHSGLLAVRAAVTAAVPITFKILYNDAVAMTGGQPPDGLLDPARVTRQLQAEGVGRIALVSDQPDAWRGDTALAPGTSVHARTELDAVQRSLRAHPGVSALLYVQTCAAEKRRRRKRGQLEPAPRRVYIHPRVCEGCGDCSVQSNCIAVEVVDTPFGAKRRIDQHACNVDALCLQGFCPSFVEVEGGALRQPDPQRIDAALEPLLRTLPQPVAAPLQSVCNVLIAGIGGSGVLTVGALLADAAHRDGLALSTLDCTGLAQKNGAVLSQLRFAADAGRIPASRIGPGAVDLLLGADLVVAASALDRLAPQRSAAVLNLAEQATADMVRQRDLRLPLQRLRQRLQQRCRADAVRALDANAWALRLCGDTLPLHLLMLGVAWQSGMLPLSLPALYGAIRSHGIGAEANRRAFDAGRLVAALPQPLQAALDRLDANAAQVAAPGVTGESELEQSLRRWGDDLVDYQGPDYAARWRRLVERASAAERRALGPDSDAFTRAVAFSAYRLLAVKDEYEVARLYTDAGFRAELQQVFDGKLRIALWLAPPTLQRVDASGGRPRKRRFGAWVLPLLALLARARRWRGRWFDPFAHTAERRAERALAAQYEADVEQLCAELGPDNHAQATQFAALVQQVRGYGPVKQQALRDYALRRAVWFEKVWLLRKAA